MNAGVVRWYKIVERMNWRVYESSETRKENEKTLIYKQIKSRTMRMKGLSKRDSWTHATTEMYGEYVMTTLLHRKQCNGH